MSKCYKPVKVYDSASEFRSVRLKPEQEVEIVTRSSLAEEPRFNHDFFSIVSRELKTEKPADGIILRFKQNKIEPAWREISTLYLGDLTCNTNAEQDNSIKVCAFLESSNPAKSNIITVINPVDTSIKIEPNNILEVVVYVPGFGAGSRWGYSFDYPDEKFQFYEMGARDVILQSTYLSDFVDVNNPYHMTPRATRWHHPECHEYHYWFRLDKSVLPTLRNLRNDVYYAGDIVLRGYKEDESESKSIFRLKVYVNHRNKSLKFFEQILQIKDFSEMAKEDYGFVKTNSTKILPKTQSDLQDTKKHKPIKSSSYPTSSYPVHKDFRQVKQISITVEDINLDLHYLPISADNIDRRDLEKMKTEFRQKPYEYYG